MIVRIAGTVIRVYAGKGEFPGHFDQGDLIRERSIGVGVGVAFPDGGSYLLLPKLKDHFSWVLDMIREGK